MTAPRPLPRSLRAHPRLATWLCLDAPGSVAVRTGKVELGQGITTALAGIAAEELDVDIARIRMVPADTLGPDEGITAGSQSVQESGAGLRQVCAEARAALLAAAAVKLGTAAADLRVVDGTVAAPDGRSLTYWDLDASVLDRDIDGSAVAKAAAVSVADPPRLDLPDKVFGRPRYVHDLRLPGQLFGRVVRPPVRGSVLTGVEDLELPPGVRTVRDGSFLGVLAEREEVAVAAAAALVAAARWRSPADPLPDEDDLPAWLRSSPVETTVALDESGDPSGVVREVRASYSRPFLAHASIAPSCAVAVWENARIRVWSHSQGVHRLREAVAAALGRDPEDVVIQHVEGAGCYGHNGADDVAFDAVLLARAVPGRPVHVVWSRADELGAAPFGPAMVVDLAAGLDAGGRISSWRYEAWSQGHTARPGYAAGTPGLLAASDVDGGPPPVPAADPGLPVGGMLRNAVPIYDIPARRIVGHRVLRTAPRASAMRSLGAHLNVFAIECFLDELAAVAGVDPLAFRLGHLSDPRARAVLTRAATLGEWGRRTVAADVGHGIAVARYKGSGAYCAVVAEIEAVHEVRVRRLVVAVDVGRVVSRDGVVNQIEGGAVQATSWTLRERVRFDRDGITSTDWEGYPILRFSEVPPVVVDVLDRPDEPSVGAGEAAQGPTAAAIGNAVRDALGVAVRDLPLSRERIIAALG